MTHQNNAPPLSAHVVRLLRENLRAQVPLYVVAVCAMALVAAMSALTAWVIGDIVDAMSNPEDPGGAYLVALLVLGIFMVKGIAGYVQAVSLAHAGNAIVARQQIRLYAKLLSQGAAFFDENESSDLLMRITQSAQAARTIIDIAVTGFVRDLLTLIGLIAVMFYQQPVLSAFSMIVGPLALIGVRLILRKVSTIMRLELQSLSEIFKVMQETSAGIMVIKAFGLEKHMSARMGAAVGQVNKRANALVRMQAITSPLMETLSGFAIAGIVALSAAHIFGASTASPGQLVSFVTALLMAYEPAKRLLRMRITIESNLVGVEMMHDLLDAPDRLQEVERATALPDGGAGEVTLDGVTFSYDGTNNILNELSLSCAGGQTLALVGPSGGGKSTVFNLILRLYDPIKGRVMIDGIDLAEASLSSVRSKISFVGQNTFLFSASVLENIRFGRPAARDDEVIAAAKAANADTFINALPQGYDTDVGENGAFLSGGQKQRLAIARALLKDSPILLLDEATSALDSQSEAAVQTAVEHLTKGRTTLVIAHRLSTILDADRICVIEKGRVIETGSPEELLAKNSAFRELYDQQFKAVSGPNNAPAAQETKT